jgi:cyclic lactone autoinducer peptide
MKPMVLKVGAALASVALTFTTLNVNTACLLFVHQPQLPDKAQQLRKF